ncbi:MAG TPA: UDP-N-acetylmuramoyl-tripeptide--D-alanyl-D-alanine ligase [Acidobacteriota bacterium]|nr:UDP-N-acetylmuramoyl-tripeptide--D-alanyl-D-alanine ligase [Acidobacteriota bacterium]
MIPMTVGQLADVLGCDLETGSASGEIDRVVIDSRNVQSGDLFVAIVGPRDDGHRYLPQALASGAVAVVISRRDVLDHLANPHDAGFVRVEDTTMALQRLARHVRDVVAPTVIAITGSVGKTTTKALTHALLKTTESTHASPGNFNNQWGLPLSLLGLRSSHRWMVAELGMSAAGEIAELTRLARPSIAVITNVAPAHMENFDSLAGVAAAKQELADELPADGTLIVNADDAHTSAMGAARRQRGEPTIFYGIQHEAEISARRVEVVDAAWRFELRCGPADAALVELPLPGEHSISNFLAAAAVAHALDIDATTIAARARDLTLPAMRGQVHHTDRGVVVIDDSYNASPAAMLTALETLAETAGTGRKILAVGDMLELGSWAEDAHREVGLHAAQLTVDRILTVGPLARDIGHGARAGGMPEEAITAFSMSDEAAEAIGAIVRPGDTVLVKGSRGIRMERIVQTLLRSSDDNGASD